MHVRTHALPDNAGKLPALRLTNPPRRIALSEAVAQSGGEDEENGV